MDIFAYDVYRGPNVGIYARANDAKVFLPRGFARSKAANLEKYLGAEAVYTSVANTRLLGILMVLNNHGMLLPNTITEDEMELYRTRTDLNVEVLDTKFTALGNMMCVNDRGAIVSPVIPSELLRRIADVLDVEVVQRRVAGYDQVGAMMVATSHGGIVHPETKDDDIGRMADVLGVALEPATVNGGIPFLASGVLANNKNMVVGSFTSGPEVMMLTRAFSG